MSPNRARPDIYKRVRQRGVLHAAWRHVRQSGKASRARATRNAVDQFDKESPQQLDAMARHLRKAVFEFDAQEGYLKKKADGSPRPIVVGTVRNRIVQRAILDVIGTVPAIQALVNTKTSYGGISDKGPQEAAIAVQTELRRGAAFYLRSDIANFFAEVSRAPIVEVMRKAFANETMTQLFEAAIGVNVTNLEDCHPDRNFFPDDRLGIAQGSPLSPIIANIALADFDTALNSNGVTCFRYLDDFVLLATTQDAVNEAFRTGQGILNSLGLKAYEPGHPKAEAGKSIKGVNFLGFDIRADIVAPSPRSYAKARERIVQIVSSLQLGKASEREIDKTHNVLRVLNDLDAYVKGWASAFSSCTGTKRMDALDALVDDQVAALLKRMGGMLRKESCRGIRFAAGIPLLRWTK